MINRYPADKLVIITTGSQGEPMSALTRMAFSDHRKVEIHPNDYVIISATPIPGNEKTVSRVVNELMKLGADVVYEKMYEVHVSGHACQEELKMIMGIVKPKYFIPVHGELKHLRKNTRVSPEYGYSQGENILIADNGRVAEISKKRSDARQPCPQAECLSTATASAMSARSCFETESISRRTVSLSSPSALTARRHDSFRS